MRYFNFDRHSELTFETAGRGLLSTELHLRRTLENSEIFLVTEGELHIEQSGERYTVRAGEYFISEPRISYGGYKESQSAFHWAHFVPDDSAYFSEEPGGEFSLPVYGHIGDFGPVLLLAILLEQYGLMREHGPVSSALVGAILRDLCIRMGNAPKQETEKDKRFQAIIDYFHNNPYLKEVPSVRAMAQFFGYSERYLIRLFKRNTGKTPYQYLTEKKLQRAQEMLADTDLTVYAIASSLHFNYYYFMRLFKKHTGMSPTQYRNAVIPDWRVHVPLGEDEAEEKGEEETPPAPDAPPQS